MQQITKIADGAFFVPSYSEQTIVRAYSTETTLQGFGADQPATYVSVPGLAPEPEPLPSAPSESTESQPRLID